MPSTVVIVVVPPADLEPRRSLLLRGVLDMCVLALLRQEPDHVYGLVGRLADGGLPNVSFGSLYPLVTRMRQQGLLDDTVVPSPVGPPRTVVSLTDQGRAALKRWSEQWRSMDAAVCQLLEGADIESSPTWVDAEEAR